MIQRIRAVCFLIMSTACTAVFAVPPLGLTQISPSSTVYSQMDIIDGSAYITSSTGLWKVDTSAKENLGSFSVPVKATDGELYALGGQGMLYRLDSVGPTFFHQYMAINPDIPGSEPEIWESIHAIDSELRGYGEYGDAARFYLDGTVERMAEGVAYFIDATPKGWALGDGSIVGTIGSGPILWHPHDPGQTYPLQNGFAGTIRDRITGTGVNVSDSMDVSVLLGDDPYYFLSKDDGSFFEELGYGVIVSHSNFTVINDLNSNPAEFFGFFPGINRDFPNRVMPLLQIFPQLAAIDIDYITSAASVDGYLYLTIRGSNGLYLFGARDPSVPEPTTALLLLIGLPALLRRAR